MTAQSFLYPHIQALHETYEISLVANLMGGNLTAKPGLKFNVFPVRIHRKIHLFEDLRAVLALCRLFRREKFDIVHSITPKAGLLAMCAAKLGGIPIRVHWFTGQVWVTQSGPKRWFLKGLDRLTASLATHVLVDSPSQRDFLVSERVIRSARSEVLGRGSVCGVNQDRFRPSKEVRERIRTELGVPQDAVVLIYVGRLNKDKGIEGLAEAFSSLAARLPKLWLVLVGPDEQNMWAKVSKICSNWRGRVCRLNHTDQPEQYMAAGDILCLPSYREGFGSVAIEAASCALPTVATRIYGLVDAVEEGVSGFLHTPGDVDGLAGLIERLYADPHLSLSMGVRGRSRVLKLFGQETLTAALKSFYARILQNHESSS
jgi:glycosyltransferase involved in cell wall biosynthesis